MNVQFSRRQFLKGTGAGVAGSALGAFGFGEAEVALAQAARPFKLAKATETRNTCPYCSVSCGMLMYSREEGGKQKVFHVEGDVDNPVNRGTLCPKGAGVLDFVNAKTRIQHPMHRKPGSDKFERVSWDFAMERIAQLMKEDRDANFVDKNKDGVTVNRWPTVGFLAGCATSNEPGWLTYKVTRSLGMLLVDNQARI